MEHSPAKRNSSGCFHLFHNRLLKGEVIVWMAARSASKEARAIARSTSLARRVATIFSSPPCQLRLLLIR